MQVCPHTYPDCMLYIMQNTCQVASVSPPPAAGEWTHVVASYAHSTVKIFVNGKLITAQRPCRQGGGGAGGGAVDCGKIMYPSSKDYWAHNQPSHLTVGGIENVAGGGAAGQGEFLAHHGLLGMVGLPFSKVSAMLPFI